MQMEISKEKCLTNRKIMHSDIIDDIEAGWFFIDDYNECEFKQLICEREEENIVCYFFKTIKGNEKSYRVYSYCYFRNNTFYMSHITLFENLVSKEQSYKFKE